MPKVKVLVLRTTNPSPIEIEDITAGGILLSVVRLICLKCVSVSVHPNSHPLPLYWVADTKTKHTISYINHLNHVYPNYIVCLFLTRQMCVLGKYCVTNDKPRTTCTGHRNNIANIHPREQRNGKVKTDERNSVLAFKISNFSLFSPTIASASLLNYYYSRFYLVLPSKR